MLSPECDTGNIEYKLKLTNISESRLNELTSQMRFRCNEGNGEAYYYLGVYDDGVINGINKNDFDETFENLKQAADLNNYSIILENVEVYDNKKLYKVLIREMNKSHYVDIKIAIAGSVDAGKSTLLGVLTSGVNDNGRGSSRLLIFRHPHEIESGKTSSISQHIIGYDNNGEITNYKNRNQSWNEIVKYSSKVISFYDLCGHEKYLKTTIRGLTSCKPNICTVIVGANMGITNITKEHISLCITLGIPFVIVITKIDICETRKNILKETSDSIKSYIKKTNTGKIPYSVKNLDNLDKLYSKNIVPIFYVSSVTGKNIDLLKKYFFNIPVKNPINTNQVEYHIDSVFNVKGVGTVVGGQLITGKIKLNDKLLLGPVNDKYELVIVKGIHCKRVPLEQIETPTYVCLALKKVNKNIIRRGHVLLSDSKMAKSYKEFTADIAIVKSHSTTIRVGYEPTLHINTIRQNVKILSIKNKKNLRKLNDDSNVLRTGDRALVRFKFNHFPEFVKIGDRLLLAEGKVKVVGVIREVFY